ncbi:MAG TPA: enoyl-CoA hydratase [Usitatibacter sp.]|nr:enoyl-CoA hydratase [Usitatibacter sp.]
MNDRPGEAALTHAEPVLRREVRDGVAALVLDRPRQYNALNRPLLEALHEALDAIARDETVRVVTITGAGAAFCAGHDLKEMRSLAQPEVEALFRSCSAVMQKLIALPVPVIAVVNGLATAAGCQLVAQCDLAVASSEAKFAVSGVNLGLFCSTPAVALSRNLGRKRAAEMLFTGGFIGAGQALEWGLVNRIAPPGEVAGAVSELIASLKAKPREALATGKALFYRQLDESLARAYEDATKTISCNMDTDFAREGVDAFLQKRKPDWKL